MDIKFHWLWCQENQGNIFHFWEPGTKNRGDYITNYHEKINHCTIRPEFLTPKCKMYIPRKRSEKTRSTARVFYTCQLVLTENRSTAEISVNVRVTVEPTNVIRYMSTKNQPMILGTWISNDPNNNRLEAAKYRPIIYLRTN